jgi:hypothetical protein
VIDHDLTGKLDGHSWTVEFLVYIDCTYLKREIRVVRASDSDNNNTKCDGEIVVRRSESAVADCVAVSALRIRGDAPPWRASPLVVAVQGVRQYGSTCCVDGPRAAAGHPCESVTGRPVPLVPPTEPASSKVATLSRRRLTAADSDSSHRLSRGCLGRSNNRFAPTQNSRFRIISLGRFVRY